MYRINEIFYSLQGEGVHTGRPAVFVRFSRCNLACPWCDTDFTHFTEMSLQAIVAGCLSVIPKGTKVAGLLLVLTGGEPALQVDKPLIEALHKAGFYIAIETNGTRDLPLGIDWITVSPKEGHRLKVNFADEVKVVYTGFSPEHWRQKIHTQNWLLQPLYTKAIVNTKDTIQYVFTHPNWRLSTQLHKLLGLR